MLFATSWGKDPLSGDLFLFVNKRPDRAKVLHFDSSGMAIYRKRREKTRFAAPGQCVEAAAGTPVTLTASELGLFLDGNPLVILGLSSVVDNLHEPLKRSVRLVSTGTR